MGQGRSSTMLGIPNDGNRRDGDGGARYDENRNWKRDGISNGMPEEKQQGHTYYYYYSSAGVALAQVLFRISSSSR